MSSPRSSISSEDQTRKRVCKACDRCRLKKSKCDGSSPCSRCKADNAICVFGERKKTHDKIYPKGYVEMLEQQQTQLVNGLRAMYGKLIAGEGWSGKALRDSHDGFPLTHDILQRLNVLHLPDAAMTHEGFEDDLDVLQQRCRLENGGASMRRRAVSEESEPGLTSSESSHGRSPSLQSPSFNGNFAQETPPTPPMNNTTNYRAFAQKSQQYSPMPSFQQQTQSSYSEACPAAFLQQAWAARQLPLDGAMDVDMSYTPTMTDDLLLFSTPNPFQYHETMPMNVGWPDPSGQVINPNVLNIA